MTQYNTLNVIFSKLQLNKLKLRTKNGTKSGSSDTRLIIQNEEINDIMKIVKSLEGSGLLIKDDSETIKNEAKEQKGGFLKIPPEQVAIRVGQDFQCHLII